jgi:hypothetical protein
LVRRLFPYTILRPGFFIYFFTPKIKKILYDITNSLSISLVISTNITIDDDVFSSSNDKSDLSDSTNIDFPMTMKVILVTPFPRTSNCLFGFYSSDISVELE